MHSYWQIGNWNSTKLAVLHEDIQPNSGNRSSTGVAGKKIRTVIVLVRLLGNFTFSSIYSF